jgi:hypothetical protein
MVRGRRSALSYGDLAVAEGGCDGSQCARSNDALGGKQKQVLMVEVASSMAIAGLLRRWYGAFE